MTAKLKDMDHPMQPIGLDEDGIVRFKGNAIVRFLLDAGPFDLNKIAMMPWDDRDREQLAQLIGYSVSGFGELSYCRREVVVEADKQAEVLLKKEKRKK